MSVFDFPKEFRSRDIATNGTSIYVRAGGTGPAVVLLHGLARRETCGRYWLPTLHAIIRSWFRICEDWAVVEACRRFRQEDASGRCGGCARCVED